MESLKTLGKVSLYLHPKTEDRLLDRMMEAEICAATLKREPLSLSEVVRKHLEFAFKAPITEVMKE